ncbi:NUDIX hydrolase [Halobacillus sp. A5]|uniref:NUDIX hydrolase n=1 Tax=Halobacillus sp. A5 TaxID=2880263 RepID=UPI0020A636C8|nr:NUDIX hydrolase [Halobacillus sp. A5]MCP3028924.1 NUDIX hydrolase [Halobacillus sp. A5]
MVGRSPLILTGSVVIVVDEERNILLQHRNDGTWGLPGGLQELGESMEETGKREVKEETGLEVSDCTFLDIFSGDNYFFKLANGDQFYSVTAVFVTNTFRGELKNEQKEGKEVRFFSADSLPDNIKNEYKDYLNSWRKFY